MYNTAPYSDDQQLREGLPVFWQRLDANADLPNFERPFRFNFTVLDDKDC